METPAVSGPEEHGNRLRNNALNLVGNIGLALGSAAPTASIALTLAAIVAASSYASPASAAGPAAASSRCTSCWESGP